MRHMMIAVSLFAVMFIGIVIAEAVMENTNKEILVLCEKMENAVFLEDREDAEQIFFEIEKKWEEEKAWLFLILNHADIDSIDSSLKLTRASVTEWDKDICYQNVTLLRFFIDELLDTEKVSFENIF